MDESDLNKFSNTSITKTHEEILEMLEEIKEFEKKYGEINIEDSLIDQELPDFEYVAFEEIEPDLIIFKEIKEKKSDFINKLKKIKINFGKKRKIKEIEKIEIPKNPTTFRLKINKEGILENIDIKHPGPRKKIKFSFRKKDKKDSESSDEKSKFTKLINGLSKIKRIIPKRGKEEENESIEPESNEIAE